MIFKLQIYPYETTIFFSKLSCKTYQLINFLIFSIIFFKKKTINTTKKTILIFFLKNKSRFKENY